MTADEGLTVLEALVRIVPGIAEAVRRVIVGHPSAQRVADVLREVGESELVAEELRRGGGS